MEIEATSSHKLQINRLAKAYLIAKRVVIDNGYASEIDWQYEVRLEELDESSFLRETAWVILSCGFREEIIRKKFSEISECFFEWDSAQLIVENAEFCKSKSLKIFNHSAKINAIIAVAMYVYKNGLAHVVHMI